MLLIVLDWRRSATRRSAVRLATGLAGGLVLLAPVFAGYAAVAQANPDLVHQSVWSASRETMAWRDSLRWNIGAFWIPTDASTAVYAAYETWGPLLLCIAGALLVGRAGSRAKRAWTVALLWTLVGLASRCLNFDPVKAALLPWFPPIRTILRMDAAAIVGLPILVGVSVHAIDQKLSRAGRTAMAHAVCLVLIALHLARLAWIKPTPYPTLRIEGPPSAALDVRRRDGGPLLELPADTLDQTAMSMYRSTFHWRPLLTGYASYWPAKYPERLAIAGRLPDRNALTSLRRETGIDLVLVRLSAMRAKARAPWLDAAAVQQSGLALVSRTPDELLFEVSRDIAAVPPPTR